MRTVLVGLVAVLPAAVLGIAGSAAFAGTSNPLPVGPQFQVNSYSTGSQNSAAIAADADGDFVVVWQSAGSSGGDTDLNSIQGQRYAADGTPSGSEFQVNGFTTNHQTAPAIAMDADGDFVVAWISFFGSSGGDNDSYSVQGQRYTASGSPSGSEFQVNGYTTNSQSSPAIAADTDGDFVVVWESLGSSGGDTDNSSVQGQRYAASGNPSGSEFQVNGYTTSDQRRSAIAADADGDFVVVWQSNGSSGGDTSEESIQGQRYAASGTPSGSQFQVNGYTSNSQSSPAIAAEADGDFVVVWQSDGSNGDPFFSSIQGQRYAANGTLSGGQFQVNGYTAGRQQVPAIATDADGDFVVVWQSNYSSGSDPSYSIHGQRFAASGAPAGSQFQVNSYTTDIQAQPAIAADADGDFVVVWHSYGSGGGDSSGASVQTQRFRVTGDLQGTVFLDRDSDGIQGGSEPGVAGITVELYDFFDLRRTTVTDANGDYSLKPKVGFWYLNFVPPSNGFTFTTQDAGGDDATDSDADPSTGETDPFQISINVLDDTIDAGILPDIFADGFESGDTSAWSATVP